MLVAKTLSIFRDCRLTRYPHPHACFGATTFHSYRGFISSWSFSWDSRYAPDRLQHGLLASPCLTAPVNLWGLATVVKLEQEVGAPVVLAKRRCA